VELEAIQQHQGSQHFMFGLKREFEPKRTRFDASTVPNDIHAPNNLPTSKTCSLQSF
jgi:hypothetical protein